MTVRRAGGLAQRHRCRSSRRNVPLETQHLMPRTAPKLERLGVMEAGVACFRSLRHLEGLRRLLVPAL